MKMSGKMTYILGVHTDTKVCLHQTSVKTQSQRCDDASDTAHIEINGVAPE